MRTFKDAKGRTYEIALNIGASKFLRDAAGFDIGKAGWTEVRELVNDSIRFFEVLHKLAMRKRSDQIAEDDFLEEMTDAEITDPARVAFLAEVTDFFLSGTARKAVHDQREESMRPKAQKTKAESSGPKSTGLPESSELLPASSLTGNCT